MNIEDEAKHLLQAEIDQKVQTLAQYRATQAKREQAEHAATQARSDEAQAWKDVRNLWTNAQLTQLKVSGPPKSAASTTPRRRRRTSTAQSTERSASVEPRPGEVKSSEASA